MLPLYRNRVHSLVASSADPHLHHSHSAPGAGLPGFQQTFFTSGNATQTANQGELSSPDMAWPTRRSPDMSSLPAPVTLQHNFQSDSEGCLPPFTQGEHALHPLLRLSQVRQLPDDPPLLAEQSYQQGYIPQSHAIPIADPYPQSGEGVDPGADLKHHEWKGFWNHLQQQGQPRRLC